MPRSVLRARWRARAASCRTVRTRVVLLGSGDAAGPRPDEALRPHGLTEFALCLSIGMLLAVIPVYADDELGVGQLRRRARRRRGQPDAPRLSADRRTDRRSARPQSPRRRGRCSSPAVSVAAYTVVDSLELLIVLRMLTGIGEGLLLVGAATMITDLAPEHRRGEALSLYSLGLWGGLALGPVLGELALGDDRFDAVWLLAGGCLPGGRADRTVAARDGAPTEPAPSSFTDTTRPSGSGRPRPRSRADGLRIRRAGDLRRALRTRARTRRRRRGLSRVLGRHRCDADRRSTGFRTRSGRSARRSAALVLIAAGLSRDRFLERAAGPVRRDGRSRVRACVGVPLADDAGRQRSSGSRTELRDRHIHGVHRAGVPGRRR